MSIASRKLNRAILRNPILTLCALALWVAASACRPKIVTANPEEFQLDAAVSTDSATQLSPSPPGSAAWEQASPTNSPQIRARWTPSASTNVQGQMLEIFSDANCASLFGSEILIPSNDTSEYALSLPDGTFTFRVTASTETQKNASSDCSQPIIVDRTAPILTGLADDSDPALSKSWSWSCNESSCRYRFAIDQNSSGTPGGEYGATIAATQATGTGTYYLHVEAIDAAENSSGVATVSAVLDNTPPGIPSFLALTSPSVTPNKNPTPTVRVSGVSPGDTVELHADAGCTTLMASGVAAGVTVDLTSSALSDGAHGFYAKAIDPLGNASACSSTNAEYTLDTVAPSVSGISDDLTPRMSKSWTWSCDETCTFRYLIDQTSDSAPAGAFSNATSATQALATGTFFLHVQAMDAAGNLSQAVTVSTVLDNTAPGIPSGLSLVAPATSPDSSATPTIRVSGVTAGDTIELHANASCTSLKSSGTSTGTSIDLTSDTLSDGSYSFYAKAIDALGNASGCSVVSASYTMISGGAFPNNGGNGFVDMSGNALLFHFNEPAATGDRTFSDSSGSGITATCASATCPTTVAGPLGNFLRFTGGQFLSLGTQLSQAFGSITISVWERNGSGHLLERYAWDYEPGFGMVMQGTAPQFGHWFGGSGYATYNLPLQAPAIVDNTIWHHIVGTMAPTGTGTTQWKIYVDGVLANSVIDVRTITSTATQSTCIGRRCTENRYFSGDIEELAIWNRALSAAEVQAIFDAQKSIRD